MREPPTVPPGRRRPRGGLRAALAAGTTVVVAALVPIALATRSGGGAAGGPDSPDSPDRRDSPGAAAAGYLVDVDADGAIVEDGRARVVRAVRSSGEAVWSDAEAYTQGSAVSCAGRCPQAVASAGAGPRIPPGAPDPPPRPLGRAPLALAPHVTSRVLAADGQASVLVVADGDGRAWLETWAGDRRTARVPLPSPDTAWRPTSDDSAAAAVSDTADPNRFEVRALRRGPGGWILQGEALTSSVPFGCARAQGDVIVADPQPRLVRPSGPRVVIPDLRSGGECAFGRTGAVVAQLSVSARGPVARVVIVDGAGSVRWQGDVEGDTRVRADHRSDRFVMVVAGTTVERAADGAILRTIPGTDDARYDDRGQLVVLDHDGSVRWLPPMR